MIRKQIYLEPRQDRLLKRRARDLGLSEAELIRRSIDSAASLMPALPRSKEAWKEILAYVRRHRSMDVPQTGRRWRREDLYEERLERLSR